MSDHWYEVIGPENWDWFRIPPLPEIPIRREFDYYVSAAHRWGLPGLNCPICGPWTSRLPLPAFDLTGFSREQELRSVWAAKIEEYSKLANELREYLGVRLDPRIELVPGTYFGPLVGSGKGRKCGQFAYVLGSVLCTVETAELLQSAGVRMVTGPCAELTFAGKLNPRPRLVEVHAEPLAKFDHRKIEFKGEECSICGRRAVDKILEEVLIADSLPTMSDVVRPHIWSGKLFVSDRFRRTVLQAGLAPMKFKPALLV